jgi:glycerol uptake facilitator-like aquaporin
MIGVFAATKSGAHLNPAVTIGQAAAGDLEWSKVPEYIGGQFAVPASARSSYGWRTTCIGARPRTRA